MRAMHAFEGLSTGSPFMNEDSICYSEKKAQTQTLIYGWLLELAGHVLAIIQHLKTNLMDFIYLQVF